MKKNVANKLFLVFELVNPFILKVIISIFSTFNFLRRRPKVLIYTDSRGFEVTKFWNRKNPFSSYVGRLIFKYNCVVKVCPEKFTSILDFLTFYQTLENKRFDKVILHCGIVDLAPRPESSFDQMYVSKLEKINAFSLGSYLNKDFRDYQEKYQGENTLSFLNSTALINVLLPLLKAVPNLVYISINPVLNDWDGNYWRKRPSNINDQLFLDKFLIKELSEVIDLSNLRREQIMHFTSDNVHYTNAGFDFIYKRLKPFLPKI